MKGEKFLISGGIPRTLGELMEGHSHKRAELAVVDFSEKTYKPVLSYKTPKEFCTNIRPSICFTGFSIYKNKIYAPTCTEVLVLNAESYEIIDIITDPLFNDIHDVSIQGDFLYVVVTGMDAVFKFNLITRTREVINTEGKDPFYRFSENENLNLVASTKPHDVHPNYSFFINGELWITRFKQKDAVCINDLTKRISIDIGYPHDGFVIDHLVYFTTVNGYVVAFDINTFEKKKQIKLTGVNNNDRPLGWCRGLYVDSTHFYVAYTQLRTTKFTEHLKWAKKMMQEKNLLKKPAPTRIEKYTIEGNYVSEYRFPKSGVYTVFTLQKL